MRAGAPKQQHTLAGQRSLVLDGGRHRRHPPFVARRSTARIRSLRSQHHNTQRRSKNARERGHAEPPVGGGGSGGSTKRPCCAPLLAEICHGLNQLFSGIFCQKYASCAVAVSPIWQSRRSWAACNRRAIASGRCRALWMTNHMQWGEFRRPGNSSA